MINKIKFQNEITIRNLYFNFYNIRFVTYHQWRNYLNKQLMILSSYYDSKIKDSLSLNMDVWLTLIFQKLLSEAMNTADKCAVDTSTPWIWAAANPTTDQVMSIMRDHIKNSKEPSSRLSISTTWLIQRHFKTK